MQYETNANELEQNKRKRTDPRTSIKSHVDAEAHTFMPAGIIEKHNIGRFSKVNKIK